MMQPLTALCLMVLIPLLWVIVMAVEIICDFRVVTVRVMDVVSNFLEEKCSEEAAVWASYLITMLLLFPAGLLQMTIELVSLWIAPAFMRTPDRYLEVLEAVVDQTKVDPLVFSSMLSGKRDHATMFRASIRYYLNLTLPFLKSISAFKGESVGTTEEDP